MPRKDPHAEFPTSLRINRRIKIELRNFAKALKRSVNWLVNEILAEPASETVQAWYDRLKQKGIVRDTRPSVGVRPWTPRDDDGTEE